MAKNQVSDVEKTRALALVQEHGSIKGAARASGMTYSTLHKHYHAALAAAGKPADAPSADDTAPLPNKERLVLQDRIRGLEKRLREADANTLSAEKISAYYFNLREQPAQEPDWLIKSGKGKVSAAGVPVTNWSDWHYAETVEPSQVEGANTFNIEVFDKRFATLVERTIDLCDNHMTGKNYPGIVVNLGGDMISGNIHEELQQTNEMESIPAVLDLAGKMAWGLRKFADHFGRVFVPCTFGNHGRNTKKPQAKNAAYTSFDWMACKMLDAHFHPSNPDGSRGAGWDDRVQFYIPDGFDTYYRVYGHRILLTHGDRIGSKGGDGFIGCIGPIVRGTHKLRLSYSGRGREIDTVMMGHWHNEFPLPGLRVNNCLKGYDEWAMSMRFTPTPPSQDLFFIHQERGVTCSWPVQLEGPQHVTDHTTWTSWRDAA